MVSNDGFHPSPCSSRWSSGQYRFFKMSSTSVVCCCCEWFGEIHVQLLSLSLHTPWRNGQILIDHKHFLSLSQRTPWRSRKLLLNRSHLFSLSKHTLQRNQRIGLSLPLEGSGQVGHWVKNKKLFFKKKKLGNLNQFWGFY